MVLAMNAKLVFPATETRGELIIRRINGVTIESSWETLTDTAVITIPRNIEIAGRNLRTSARDIFRNGDPVQIWLGYNGELINEFNGYITSVSADIPIEIKCDDAMYLLKRHNVNVAMRTNKVEDLIKQIIPEGIPTDVADIEVGKERFPNTTAAKVLEWLQEANIYSYFKGDTLVVGKIYSDDDEPPMKFDFNRNVVDNNLQYRLKEDILLRIIATSTLPKGKKLKVEYGDEFGVRRNLSYYNIEVEAELLKLAKLDYDKSKVAGYEGDIEIFGIPSMRHGMKATIISQMYPDRNGTYWIKSIKKEYSDQAKYHQFLTLDQKVSDE
ncbi:hypothetical protein ML462_14080 [Gramella lutea]|uniref:Uncharacterized protein n=1 Tax=Christiangramia lutea TaxID=1607951 RepID=A0A9X1V5N4_9FLAO|nr:hypothetical protein [Christiangramia lutea]MCH4824300.1 hypothetical protein [Christiangramia lutea]